MTVKRSAKQERQLNDLRRKYVAKILLSDVNLSRDVVEDGVERYMKLTVKYMKRLDEAAHATILERLDEN